MHLKETALSLLNRHKPSQLTAEDRQKEEFRAKVLGRLTTLVPSPSELPLNGGVVVEQIVNHASDLVSGIPRDNLEPWQTRKKITNNT